MYANCSTCTTMLKTSLPNDEYSVFIYIQRVSFLLYVYCKTWYQVRYGSRLKGQGKKCTAVTLQYHKHTA